MRSLKNAFSSQRDLRILLDENLDWRLARYLPGHSVESVPRVGWAGLQNGELIKRAEQQYDVFITMDVGLRTQLNLAIQNIPVIILRARSNRLADTSPLMTKVLVELNSIQPGTVTMIS